jgi:hypothetical protein
LFQFLGSAFDLLPVLISASVLFFALDLWLRAVEAMRAAGAHVRPAAIGAMLAAWTGLALLATHSSTLGRVVASTPALQPALLVGIIVAAVALASLPTCRKALDSIPLESIMTFFYWRAVFGALIIAGYAAERLPAGFGIPAGLGDIAVTMLMVLVLALRTASGEIPRGPVWLWNAIGLVDLISIGAFLGPFVLRPWAAQRGLSGNFGLQLFAVPLFIAIHLCIFGRLWRERRVA